MPGKRRSSGLPLDRHAEIGLELARLRDRLTALTDEVMGAYPAGSRPYNFAAAAEVPVDALRNELDQRARTEHSDATADLYFPPAAVRDAR